MKTGPLIANVYKSSLFSTCMNCITCGSAAVILADDGRLVCNFCGKSEKAPGVLLGLIADYGSIIQREGT